jgi:hypothetical protein
MPAGTKNIHGLTVHSLPPECPTDRSTRDDYSAGQAPSIIAKPDTACRGLVKSSLRRASLPRPQRHNGMGTSNRTNLECSDSERGRVSLNPALVEGMPETYRGTVVRNG